MGYTYNDWENVLRRKGFRIIAGRRHKKALKVDPKTGKLFRVAISRQGNKQVAKGLHKEMLKQAGLTEKDFEK